MAPTLPRKHKSAVASRELLTSRSNVLDFQHFFSWPLHGPLIGSLQDSLSTSFCVSQSLSGVSFNKNTIFQKAKSWLHVPIRPLVKCAHGSHVDRIAPVVGKPGHPASRNTKKGYSLQNPIAEVKTQKEGRSLPQKSKCSSPE